ncbi:hypothetical protein SS31_22310 [Pluralibacter gergoviae]|nr:hypothetical protein SS31_22310 [Pluralibacter gergoviae]KMK16882.1 hypothetical protein ABW09_19050 [Pluralibacter gergoviae]
MIVRYLLAPLGLCLTAGAGAASLQMYPLVVNFCNGESVRPVYVKNTGTAPIGAQLRVYQWQQKNHADVLTPATQIIISPPIASIPPGKEQLVRLILPQLPAGNSREQSWRLLLDELPGAQSSAAGEQVHFLLRYSVPVFLSCSNPPMDAASIHASLDHRGGHRRLVIRNSSNRHLKLSNVALMSGHQRYPINRGLMGYVLPGSEMAWDLPAGVPDGNAITATTSNDAASQTIPLSHR